MSADGPAQNPGVTLSDEQWNQLMASNGGGSTDVRVGIISGTFGLLRGQPFPNLVALILIFGFFALGVYVVGWGAPAFQTNTHNLVRELDDKNEARMKEQQSQHRNERKEADERWAKAIEKVGASFEKAEEKRDEIQTRQWARQAEDGKVLQDIRELMKDKMR